jgi:DNA-nicking Smr family endonuclease
MAVLKEIVIRMDTMTEGEWKSIIKKIKKRAKDAIAEEEKRRKLSAAYKKKREDGEEDTTSHHEFLARYREILENRISMSEADAGTWGWNSMYAVFDVPPGGSDYDDIED